MKIRVIHSRVIVAVAAHRPYFATLAALHLSNAPRYRASVRYRRAEKIRPRIR
jgi:hypothetical protein